MKNSIVKFFSTLLVVAAVGAAAIGCDMPEEKKSLFQRATTTQQDSSKPKTDTQADEKKDQKKPRAFSKIDHVEV